MKKFNVLFTALLCASVMFVGCSDDDDNENGGNGEGAGNGGSGVIVKPKKVVKMIETSTWEDGGNTGSSKDTTLYAYDAEGRLSKITKLSGDLSNREDVSNITYASDKIIITDVPNSSTDVSTPSIIELKDGRAIKTTSNGTDYSREVAYSYSGKYISEMISKQTEIYDGQEHIYMDTMIYSVKDGNLVNYIYSDKDDDDISTMEMSSVDNNMNIDLVYGDIAEIGDGATLLCVTGDRFKKLPAKEIYKEVGDEDDIITYAYEQDKDGYVTKITMIDGGSTNVYEITYE